jgi:uncharacterized protein (DUF433 family)
MGFQQACPQIRITPPEIIICDRESLPVYNIFRIITMSALHDSLLERITIDPDVRFGKPCIRGHRITVEEVLEWLSTGASPRQIVADHPQLEADDFRAVYAYAAELAAGRKVSKG